MFYFSFVVSYIRDFEIEHFSLLGHCDKRHALGYNNLFTCRNLSAMGVSTVNKEVVIIP